MEDEGQGNPLEDIGDPCPEPWDKEAGPIDDDEE